MPLTPEERAARREARRSDREQGGRTQTPPARNNLQGYQTESARLFARLSSTDSSNLLDSSDGSHLDISHNSVTNNRRQSHKSNLSGISEGNSSTDDNRFSMQPPGQDAAQGSPRHNRAGPFDKDSDDDDDYYGGEEGANNYGGNPFLDDSVEIEGQEFQPAKLDRSGRSGSSGRSGRANEGGLGFVDIDGGPPTKPRPHSLVTSTLTTSSSATQRVANTDEGNRRTAKDKFMEVMGDDREEATEDYGSPMGNDPAPSPFDDDSVDPASQGSYEPPRSFRPFSGGSQQNSDSGEHYASMQELLEEERSRTIVNQRTSRFGGCMEKVLGGKRTKRRMITLLVIMLLLCGAVIGVGVGVALSGSKGDKKEGVDTQSMQQIERPTTSFDPGNTGNVSSGDSTFGMADNSTDGIFDFEPTFPDGSKTSNTTTDSTSPTASPVSTSAITSNPTFYPTLSESIPAEFNPTASPVSTSAIASNPPTVQYLIPDEFKPTASPSDSSKTNQPTGSPASDLLQLAPAVEIKLHANESIASLFGHDGIMYFQPKEPPASPMTCSDQVCGGSLPFDLWTSNNLSFVWEAPDDEVVSIAGNYNMELLEIPPRTRIELELKTPNCEAEYQDVNIETVTLDFDDGGLGHIQSYTFEKSDSFLALEDDCGIFMRIQLEPTKDGILDLKFKKLTITAPYDNQKVSRGIRDYSWSTGSYMWMRRPEDGSIELEAVSTSAVDTTPPDAPDPPVTVAPVSVPSVQTDIAGVLTLSELVPQDDEAGLIVFLDALKKSIRSAVSSSLQANDELVSVEILSINGEPVDSLLSRRRFIRRRLQLGTSIEYEMVVVSDCDSPECTDSDTVASDVFSRTTDQMSTSVFSGEFASSLEVNMLSSSGGSVEYFSEVEVGDFSQPRVTVLMPTGDYGVNETSSTNSTEAVDTIAANETETIGSNATDDNAATMNICEFCQDGMPEPLKVVSDSGLTCIQLKEAVSDEDNESSTCMTVKQAEGLCCSVSTTVTDTSDEASSTNTTIASDDTNSTEIDISEPSLNTTEPPAIGGNETMLTNSTGEDLVDVNATETPAIGGNETLLTNSTDEDLGGNETLITNSTDEDLGDINATETPVIGWNDTYVTNSTDEDLGGNETYVTNSTGEDIVDMNATETPVIGWNETFVTNSTDEDLVVDVNATETPVIGWNETVSFNSTSGNDAEGNGTISSNSTSEDFVVIDAIDGNETLASDDMPVVYENGTDSGFDNDALYPDLSCPATLTRSIEIDLFASLSYEVVRPSSLEARNGIFCARLQVKSLGWIAFALSNDGQMVGSEAIIAHPDDNTVFKYSLLGKSTDLIRKVDDDRQTLRDTSVTQDIDLGVTTMEFVKHLDEFDEIPILLEGPNNFLYARGESNILGYHLGRMHFIHDFAEDVVVVDDAPVDLSNSSGTILVDKTSSSTNETIATNSTSVDFVIDTVVVGNETFVSFGDRPVTDENGTDTDFGLGNETISSNSTEDFVIIDTVVGNETLTPYEDMPAIYENGTDSGFDNDVVYPNVNSTLDDSGENVTSNDVVAASEDTQGNATVDDDPILDVELLDNLSSPYSMTRLLGGQSADSLYGFSTAVSADMSVLAVGATNAIDENGDRTGAVYLYSVETSVAQSIPTLVQVLYGSNPEDEFGNDVKLSDDGNRLVVAARSEMEEEGAIRIYNRPPESGLWELSGTILGDGAGFRAGWSVGISGDGNVVAMGSTKGGSDKGGIVSTYIAPDWTLHGPIIEAQTPRDVLGFSVALNGDGTMVAVGSVKASNPDRVTNAGRAEVYAFNGTSWISQFEVFGETKQAYVGSSVALSRDGNLFVVGGRGFTNNGESTPAVGRCRIFERTESGAYELLGELVGKDSREELGWSASISADGNKVACGGMGGKIMDWGETGVARVWDRSSFVESEVLPRGGERFSSVEGASFGSSVSLSSDGSSLVVGASTWAGVNVTSPGGVFTFFIDAVVDNETFISSGDMANETLVSGDMPVIYENGTDSGFDNDALYPDVNSTLDGSGENVTSNDVVAASEDTQGNSTLDDASGSVLNGTDVDLAVDDPIVVLDALSLPYTLSNELEGVAEASRHGFSVAMSSDGNILAVGAKDTTDAALGKVGAVHLYSMETSPPTVIQTLVNAYPNGEFGNSIGVSDDGSRLVVGARSENDQTGVVRVYGRDSSGQWALLGTPINGLSTGERAGWSVSISGDGSSVAVGAPKGGESSSGSVLTYRFVNGTNWEPYGSALEGVSNEAFGYTTSLSYDGNLVAVGSPKAMNSLESNAGKASVFYLYGTGWLPLPAKEIQGISSNDIDGTSIALSGDGAILVVGGKGKDSDEGMKNVGHCRIYEFGTDWELLHSMEGLTENERLGSSVAVSKNGSVVACGGEGAVYDGAGIGVVRLWNSETSQTSELWPRTTSSGALFGSAISLNEDGKILAVGAPERNGMALGSKTGAVDIYREEI